MSDALAFVRDELQKVKDAGLFNTIRTIAGPQGAWFEVDGRKCLNFCSNNYLGLANDERMKKAAKEAIDRYGVGPGAVRTIAGTQTIHLELEERLARFKDAEATILLGSGFTANLATIPCLVGKEDLIFSDELNHASIIDGCRLSGARIIRYNHNDPASLDEKLSAEPANVRRLVVTDGVFSMDGDIVPLPEIVKVAKKHGAMTMVDDAHGEGVLGSHGRGIVNHFHLEGQVDVEVGTLSKAFGVMGGFVSGSAELVDWLKQRGRPFLFSSALTAADVAAGIAAVDILEESDELVKKLWDNARYFKAKMQQLGFDTGKSETPITPVMVGDAIKAKELSKGLFEEGVFAMAIAYPTVPQGKARIRVMISASHEHKDLDFAAEKFAKVGRSLGLIK
ncbi:MAG: glycine C-acetyltransferase [Chloroflexota bacterium]